MAVSTLRLGSVSNLPDIPDSPHQPGPGFKFPKQSFGKATVVFRSFQSTWFRQCSAGASGQVKPDHFFSELMKFIIVY